VFENRPDLDWDAHVVFFGFRRPTIVDEIYIFFLLLRAGLHVCARLSFISENEGLFTITVFLLER